MAAVAPYIGLATSVIGAFSESSSAGGLDEAAEKQREVAPLYDESARLQDEAATLVLQSSKELRASAVDVEQAAYDEVIASRMLGRTADMTLEGGRIQKDIFALNSVFDEMETREESRRLEWSHLRERGNALAQIGASGLAFVGSPVRVIEEMDQVLDDEVSWLNKGLSTRKAISDFESRVSFLSAISEAEGIRSQEKAGIAGARETEAAAKGIRASASSLEAQAKTTQAGAEETRARGGTLEANAAQTEAQADAGRGSALGTLLGGAEQFGDSFNWWQS